MSNLDRAIIWPFPWPDTPALIRAYNTLVMAAGADDNTRQALGDPSKLPRPWDPATCTDRQLRTELWAWLESVVTWLNHEYVWDHTSNGLIPACWPHHPHLVHDIAVLADQRRRAGLDLTSSTLEEWHRYCLPNFYDRLKARTRSLCENEHADWPARGRYQRHTNRTMVDDRTSRYQADLDQLPAAPPECPPPPRLHLIDEDGDRIDPTSGEVL